MKLLIRGVVQGVGFRPTVYRIAKSMRLCGYVTNKGADVEIAIDKNYNLFLEKLKKELSPLAKINEIIILSKKKQKFNDFTILNSSDGARLSLMPPDTAICNECLEELFDGDNKRYLYPFTNCTNCGARFSVIKNLPYDRKNTSMNNFKLCPDCSNEYRTPADRRFHAQTTSCPTCGPKYILYGMKGESIPCNRKNKENVTGNIKYGKVVPGDPIKNVVKAIDAGKVCIIKGWGGMHIACNLHVIQKVRKLRGRREKPFAIMVRDIETVKKLAVPTKFEKKLLKSPQRPIILLKKNEQNKETREILEEVSPGLNTVGVMLPYSGLHNILFHYLKNDALIMTSANMPGEPMIINNEDAFKFDADYYLLHNREILNRCDDTVLRTFGEKTFFIRRSRGFIPTAIDVPYDSKILSFGAEENVTVSITKNKKMYPSQYLGDAKYYGAKVFINETIERLRKILDIKNLDGIGVDMHPRYVTKNMGVELSKELGCDIIEIQHHWAHAASLMVDNNIDEPIIALTLDGTGYGNDGTAWGGEVLKCSFDGFERVGSLENIPLIGGDAAVREPARIVFAIFDAIGKETSYYNPKQAEILRKLIKNSVKTSSFGRILDAFSCYLNICTEMTYDGEPAMKLEKYLDIGKLKYSFDTEIIKNDGRKVVRTIPVFEQMEKCKKETDKERGDIAYSAVYCLLNELVNIAVDEANRSKIRHIGITGGVSYNEPIVNMTKELLKKQGFELVVHNSIPNGDGGISIGQNRIVASIL
ncbi:MAG: carbamoyltransferase HypF [Thermoplasmata archaeon]